MQYGKKINEIEDIKTAINIIDHEKWVEQHSETQKNEYCIHIPNDAFQKQNYRLSYREKNNTFM